MAMGNWLSRARELQVRDELQRHKQFSSGWDGDDADHSFTASHPDPTAPRSAVPAVYQWNLTPLSPSDAAWDQARNKLLEGIPALSKYKGKLTDPAALQQCLQLYFQLHKDANFVTTPRAPNDGGSCQLVKFQIPAQI